MITPEISSQKIYYLYHHHHQEGPYSLFELADELNSVEPNSHTQVLCVGWPQWVPYEDLGKIQDVCVARRKHPGQFQTEATQKWSAQVHQEQRRRFGAGSFAQFRLSAAPKVQPTNPNLIPSPHKISWRTLVLIAIGCVTLSAGLTWLFRPW